MSLNNFNNSFASVTPVQYYPIKPFNCIFVTHLQLSDNYLIVCHQKNHIPYICIFSNTWMFECLNHVRRLCSFQQQSNLLVWVVWLVSYVSKILCGKVKPSEQYFYSFFNFFILFLKSLFLICLTLLLAVVTEQNTFCHKTMKFCLMFSDRYEGHEMDTQQK